MYFSPIPHLPLVTCGPWSAHALPTIHDEIRPFGSWDPDFHILSPERNSPPLDSVCQHYGNRLGRKFATINSRDTCQRTHSRHLLPLCLPLSLSLSLTYARSSSWNDFEKCLQNCIFFICGLIWFIRNKKFIYIEFRSSSCTRNCVKSNMNNFFPPVICFSQHQFDLVIYTQYATWQLLLASAKVRADSRRTGGRENNRVFLKRAKSKRRVSPTRSMGESRSIPSNERFS